MENTSTSLEMMEGAILPSHEDEESIELQEGAVHPPQPKENPSLGQRENWLQILNPGRFLLMITITPLRMVLFGFHLIAIGVTSDRLPGFPEILSALMGIISEGFEDYHYFLGHDEHHHSHAPHQPPPTTQELVKERFAAGRGHNHGNDIPTQILKLVFFPVYLFATVWDFAASQINALITSNGDRPFHSGEAHDHEGHGHEAHGHAAYGHVDSVPRRLGFWDAWYKQTGQQEINSVEKDEAAKLSHDWIIEHALYRTDRFKEKHLSQVRIGQSLAKNKSNELANSFQKELRQISREKDINGRKSPDRIQHMTALLGREKGKEIYGKHRFFNSSEKTSTQKFLEEDLPNRIGVSPDLAI